MTNQKLSVTIDVSKIDKSKLIKRTFKTREGVEKTVTELKLDIVPLKEIRVVATGDTWTLLKTHFVAEQQTKEERENKIKSHIIGEGMMFENKEEKVAEKQEIEYPSEHFSPDDVPF